jgi:hypothetical protein
MHSFHILFIRLSIKNTDDEICKFAGEIEKIVATLLTVSRNLQFWPGGSLVNCGKCNMR